MRNLEFEKKIVVTKCDITADQWQLFTCSMNCGNAARQLNEAVKQAAEQAKTRSEFIEEVYKTQRKLAEYGAADTEPNWVVEDIATKLYGREYEQ